VDESPEIDQAKYRTIANMIASLRVAFYELGLFQEWAIALNNEFAQLLTMQTAESADDLLERTRQAAELGRAEQPARLA
jgi:hypothetical protein